MTYFPDNCSPDDARLIYRKLARTMHPDVGGDEAAMKVLNGEYEAIQRRHISAVMETVEDLMARSKVIADKCLEIIREMYPRTKIAFDYSAIDVSIIFYGAVPLEKMVRVLDTCQNVAPAFKFKGEFQRGTSEKVRKFERKAMWVLLDWGNNPLPDMFGMKTLKDGPRWTHMQSRTVQLARDKKTNDIYVLRRTPKLSLWDMV